MIGPSSFQDLTIANNSSEDTAGDGVEKIFDAGRSPGQQRFRVTRLDMASAPETERRHAGRSRAKHPEDRVLDDDAAIWFDPHRCRREQEQVGCRLAACNLMRGEDVLSEELVEPGQAQAGPDPLGVRR